MRYIKIKLYATSQHLSLGYLHNEILLDTDNHKASESDLEWLK